MKISQTNSKDFDHKHRDMRFKDNTFIINDVCALKWQNKI